MIKLLNAVILIGLFIWNPYPLQLLELKSYDYLIMSEDPVQNENILLVELDEEIVEAYEGYPLPRDLYANKQNRRHTRNYCTNARPRHSRKRVR